MNTNLGDNESKLIHVGSIKCMSVILSSQATRAEEIFLLMIRFQCTHQPSINKFCQMDTLEQPSGLTDPRIINKNDINNNSGIYTIFNKGYGSPVSNYAYPVRPTALSAALTAAARSRWKNGVSVDTIDAYPAGGESESLFLTDSISSLSTTNPGNSDGLFRAAISC